MKRSEIELNLPAGFRFHPTDEELVNHYLIQKCASKLLPAPIITEVDLYKFDPWQLPELALYGEKEWYFFSPRDRKYPNGSRPNRAAGTGYWKATGADKPIGQPALGIKKALVFYAGKAPGGVKTNWIMHEYRLANVDRSARNQKKTSRLDDWVLCRIYNKKGIMEKHLSNQVKSISINMEEDKKTDVVFIPGLNFNQQVQLKPDIWAPMKTEDHTFSDITDSIPKLQQESSSSEHAVSPDSQVQSEPRWEELELDKDFDFQFDGFLNDPFGPDQFQFQMDQFSALQDMLQFPQKPF